MLIGYAQKLEQFDLIAVLGEGRQTISDFSRQTPDPVGNSLRCAFRVGMRVRCRRLGLPDSSDGI